MVAEEGPAAGAPDLPWQSVWGGMELSGAGESWIGPDLRVGRCGCGALGRGIGIRVKGVKRTCGSWEGDCAIILRG